MFMFLLQAPNSGRLLHRPLVVFRLALCLDTLTLLADDLPTLLTSVLLTLLTSALLTLLIDALLSGALPRPMFPDSDVLF